MMIQTLHMVSAYEEEKVYKAICLIMEELDILQELKPEMKVVLKPNLIMAKNPSVPVTTNPVVIKAVGRWLYEHGIYHVTLAESSGGPYNADYMRRVYHTCGLTDLAPYITLNNDFTAGTVHCPPDFQTLSFHLLTPIMEADYIINLCKLKTHAMTGYSGGIKNLFGTIPGLEKPQLHYRFPDLDDFSNMLLELAQTVNPALTIIDAIDAMEGNGPTGGTSHPLHMLLGSKDLYTQDYFAAGLMGLDPMEISMIRQAVEQSLAKPSEMILKGDPVPTELTPFQVPDTKKLDFSSHVPAFLQKPMRYVASRLFKSYPQVDLSTCVGCGKCAESCPASVIHIADGKAHFKKKGCISCFCCQEMCPVKAISVRRAL